MNIRGTLLEVVEAGDDGEMMEGLVSEFASQVAFADDVWKRLIEMRIVKPEDMELRKLIFDKCTPHLPFLIADVLCKSTSTKEGERATGKQIEYYLALCHEGRKEGKADEVAQVLHEKAGVGKDALSNVIEELNKRYGGKLRERRAQGGEKNGTAQ